MKNGLSDWFRFMDRHLIGGMIKLKLQVSENTLLIKIVNIFTDINCGDLKNQTWMDIITSYLIMDWHSTIGTIMQRKVQLENTPNMIPIVHFITINFGVFVNQSIPTIS